LLDAHQGDRPFAAAAEAARQPARLAVRQIRRPVRRGRDPGPGRRAEHAGAARPAREFAEVGPRQGHGRTGDRPDRRRADAVRAAGLRIWKKPALQNLPLFKEGAIEVQDEGSQVLAQLLGARRGEMVVDFCAGAGGKTLAIGAIMRSTGRLYAFDVSEKRLTKLKPRLARSGLSNVHPVVIAHERDAKVKRLAGKIDRVLVDAPCSGMGTLRRNPDVKWRQQPEGIAELTEKQASILDGAARLVKFGGRLVYATCSLLDEENEGIVQGNSWPPSGFRTGADAQGPGGAAHSAGNGRLPENAAAQARHRRLLRRRVRAQGGRKPAKAVAADSDEDAARTPFLK
jgi:16S rRNA (cytosine967-C5)-methyltransferase